MRALSIASYLAFKEVWRNRGRFLLVSSVIALITLLVLFIAALGEGLANANRQYVADLDSAIDRVPPKIGLHHRVQPIASGYRRSSFAASTG